MTSHYGSPACLPLGANTIQLDFTPLRPSLLSRPLPISQDALSVRVCREPALGELLMQRWVNRGAREPVPIHGPTGIDEGGVKVTAFRVDHTPVDPAVGYRFDYGGRSLVLSGDTIKSENLQRFAEDVDLLVHEALAPHGVAVLTRGAEAAGRKKIAKITRDILSYHASPVDAAEVARDAGVGFLLYYHIVPPLPLAPL